MERDNEYFSKLNKEFKEIFKKIKKSDRIVIFRHQVPDFDALGTQMGLYAYIKHNFPSKEVHYVGDVMKSFIPRIFPEPEVLDDSFYEKPYLAIIVDTADTKRVSMLNLSNATDVIKLDHHPDVEKYETITCVHPEMSAASELVALLLLSMGGRKYPLNKEAAYYFYIGIVGDSGRFMFPEVSSMTLRVAGSLLDTGIDKDEIYNKMYFTSKEEFNFQKYVLTHYHVTKAGTCYYIINDEELKSLKLTPGEGKLAISLFRNVEGINTIVSCTQDVEHNEYRVSLRSISKPVSKVASMFNGGGHLFASGAKVKTLEEFKRLIKETDQLEEVKNASN